MRGKSMVHLFGAAMIALACVGAVPAQESPLDRAVGQVAPQAASEHVEKPSQDQPPSPPTPLPQAGEGSPETASTESSASATNGDAKPGMFREFIASWTLFRYSYLEGWLVGLVLSLVGVIVVARDQIFLGAAVSQASTLGVALALCASSRFPVHDETANLPHGSLWLCCDTLQPAMAVVFSMLAALITSQAVRVKRESHEAITGWVFLVSASLSVLLVAHSHHGLEEIYHIHSSSIIGATASDVGVFAALLALTVVLLAAAGPRLLLFVTDPSMAAAVGMKVGRWAVAESLWLGLLVGLSIRATGMLYTFGSLVLPALVAKNVCREVRAMFFVAPAVALATSTIGFVLSNHYDFPPAQMSVALACLLLLAAWTFRTLFTGRAAR